MIWGLWIAVAFLSIAVYVKDRREKRREREYIRIDMENEDMVCKRPPKGWICVLDREHEGDCDAHRDRQPVHFLRRNEKGKLERLVTDGKWVGWVSAERGTRGWIVWQAIAKARGI